MIGKVFFGSLVKPKSIETRLKSRKNASRRIIARPSVSRKTKNAPCVVPGTCVTKTKVSCYNLLKCTCKNFTQFH